MQESKYFKKFAYRIRYYQITAVGNKNASSRRVTDLFDYAANKMEKVNFIVEWTVYTKFTHVRADKPKRS